MRLIGIRLEGCSLVGIWLRRIKNGDIAICKLIIILLLALSQ